MIRTVDTNFFSRSHFAHLSEFYIANTDNDDQIYMYIVYIALIESNYYRIINEWQTVYRFFSFFERIKRRQSYVAH